MRLSFLFLLVSLCTNSLLAQVYINEMCSSNGHLADDFGNYSDWIELYNSNNIAVNLNQYCLTDNNNLQQWQLPNVTIAAHGFLLIWASGYNLSNSSQALHTNFKLSDNETVRLVRPNGTIADLRSTALTHHNNSVGQVGDGTNTWCLIQHPTPNSSNNVSSCFNGYAPAVSFNAPTVFATTSSICSLNVPLGMTVRYTTDGSEPNATSLLYSQPIVLSNSTVIHAKAFGSNNTLPSLTITQHFFINETTSLPVLAITATPWEIAPMLNEQNNNNPPIAAHIAYYTADKNLAFAQNIGVEQHGNGSTACPQRSLKLKTLAQFDSDNITYPIFEQAPYLNINEMVLRNAGNDCLLAHMRDNINQRLADNTFCDHQQTQAVVVYVNGSYRGVYHLHEALDEYFPENHYNIAHHNLNILRNNWTIADGQLDAQAGDLTNFEMMHNFFTTNNMATTANYTLAKSMIDLKSWVDYLCFEIYCGNQDWLINNMKLWQRRNPPSPWHYMLMDTDWSYGLNSNANSQTLAYLLNNSSKHSNLVNAILANTSFRNYFLNRFADLLNTNLQSEAVIGIKNEIANTIAYDIERTNLLYWGNESSQTWNNELNKIEQFAIERPAAMRQQLIDQFDLDGQVEIQLQVNPPNAGTIKINSIIPDSYPWNGYYFNGVPVSVTAIPHPGYTFSHWTAGSFVANTQSQSLTANVNTNHTFTANFSGAAQQTPSLTVSELNYNSDSTRSSGDWIELHNFGNTPIDLSDWQLLDQSTLMPYLIPTGTVIPSNGYLVIYGDLQKFTQQYPSVSNKVGPFSFFFNNDTETLRLLDNLGVEQLSLTYTDSISFPQCADGLGRTLERINPNNNTNLSEGSSWFDGCMGGSPGTAYQSCNSPIAFNEINYKSAVGLDAGDWVELKNNSSSTINLSGWKFTDDTNTFEYTFPVGTTLAPNAYLVVCANTAFFDNINPNVPNRIGNFLFGLDGNGDALRLYDNNGRLYLSMVYNDAAPWPESPDGEGTTLQLSDPQANPNAPANWYAGCLRGTPGQANAQGLNVSITGSETVCATNNTKTYSVVPVAGSTYQWIVTGGTILSGQGTATITVQWTSNQGGISIVQTTP